MTTPVETRRRTVLQLAAIAVGYVAAGIAALAVVRLRSAGVDPQDLAASAGMWAFGDLLRGLAVGAAFCLAPTWFLLRLLRGVASLWGPVSGAALAWACTIPLALGLVLLPALLVGQTEVGDLSFFFLILRTPTAPAFLAAALAAHSMSRAAPSARRRLAVAAAFEALGVASMVLWLSKAAWDRLRY